MKRPTDYNLFNRKAQHQNNNKLKWRTKKTRVNKRIKMTIIIMTNESKYKPLQTKKALKPELPLMRFVPY